MRGDVGMEDVETGDRLSKSNIALKGSEAWQKISELEAGPAGLAFGASRAMAASGVLGAV